MSPHSRALVEPELLNRGSSGTRWTNPGFWRGTDEYPEAARALAQRVGQAAGLRAGDTVLDCACGYGDSLALWVREFGARRVIGVEPDVVVAGIAARRVREWGLADRVTIVAATAESLVPERDAPQATAVVCVDAACHFLSRSAWLVRLAKGLAGGTRLGFTDLTLTRRSRNPKALQAVARRAGIPEENLWYADEIEPQLADAGFILDRLVRCGPEVLGGFTAHAMRSAVRWMVQPALGGWRALALALEIASARRRHQLEYVVISGRTAVRVTAPLPGRGGRA